MAFDPAKIQTVFIVIMENRSFDHLLGYLSLGPDGRADIDGLRDTPGWLDSVASKYQDGRYPPFPLTKPFEVMDADPPHERAQISNQMGVPAGGVFPMEGFVANYATAKGATPPTPGTQPSVMGYFSGAQVPVADFLAQKFAVCDHWFCSLPAGTQPNRLMAMSGFSMSDVNRKPLEKQDLVYDWLTNKGIRWRVYHEGIPFFSMMLERIPEILGGEHFRPFAQLFDDVQNEPPGVFPQVVFIEPTYTDAPHLGPGSDDHAPSAICGGQGFLFEAYRGVSRVPEIWQSAVMIVTYDEHGGFFDHISPPAMRTDAPPGANYESFESLGVRVPALVISPFVTPGSVFSEIMDHTSILKLLGQCFGGGAGYSDLVDNRGVGSVLDVLSGEGEAQEASVMDSLDDYLANKPPGAGIVPGTQPSTEIQQSFTQALEAIRAHPNGADKFPELLANFPPGAAGS